jgi:hypothetical protein
MKHFLDPNVNTNLHYNIHSDSVLMSHLDADIFKKLASFICAYHHSHHRDNVTAPHGRPNLRSRLHFRHSQEGGPRKFV